MIMMSKEALMRHKKIWAHIRLANRTITGWKADRDHYYQYTQGKNNRTTSPFRGLKEKLVNDIRKECISKVSLLDHHNKTKLADVEMLSYNGDQMGKVFKSNGKIYRGIYKNKVKEFENIWNKGVFQVLWRYGLIPEIKISQYMTDEFPVVLEIQTVEIVDNSNWTFAMIRDACCLVCLLVDVLNEFECTLLDGHLNNVTFDHGKPVFVDIGSVIGYRPTAAKEELAFCGLFRLLFGTLGNVMLYRMPVFNASINTAFLEPRFYNQLTRDYRYCLRSFLRYQMIHHGPIQYLIAFRMFHLYEYDVDSIERIFPTYLEKDVINEGTLNAELYESMIRDLSDCFEGKTVVDIGGGSDFVERILEIYSVPKAHYLDFNEKRLDQVYLQNDKHHNIVHYSLVNYIYLQKDQISKSFEADTVVAWFPLLNSRSYQGLNVQTIANQMIQLGKEKIFIIENNASYNLEILVKELEKKYELKCVMETKEHIAWKGTRKH